MTPRCVCSILKQHPEEGVSEFCSSEGALEGGDHASLLGLGVPGGVPPGCIARTRRDADLLYRGGWARCCGNPRAGGLCSAARFCLRRVRRISGGWVSFPRRRLPLRSVHGHSHSRRPNHGPGLGYRPPPPGGRHTSVLTSNAPLRPRKRESGSPPTPGDQLHPHLLTFGRSAGLILRNRFASTSA